MRKFLAIMAVATVVLAGCSTKNNTSSGGTGASNSGGSATGVTTTSVRVGITYVDLAAIRQFVSIDDGDFQAAYTALIDNVNASGGINGRKIVPYLVAVNPIGTDPAAVACTKLTEDDKVFVEVGFMQNDDALCYVHIHDTPVVGVSLTDAQQAQARATWFNTTLTLDHSVPKVLTAVSSKGLFNGQKVAVVGQTGDQAEMSGMVLPELKKLGVNVVQTAIEDAPESDVQAGWQRYQLIAEKFQSAGASVVVAVGSAGNGWPHSLQINHSSYLPRLVATDEASLISYATDKSGNDPQVLTGAVTAGVQAPNAVIWNDPTIQSCVRTVEQAYPNEKINDPTTATPSTPTTWVATETACGQVALLTDILKAAGPNLNQQTFLTGGESLSSVLIPGTPVPFHFGPDSHDGDGPIYLSQYDTGKKELVTQSTPS